MSRVIQLCCALLALFVVVRASNDCNAMNESAPGCHTGVKYEGNMMLQHKSSKSSPERTLPAEEEDDLGPPRSGSNRKNPKTGKYVFDPDEGMGPDGDLNGRPPCVNVRDGIPHNQRRKAIPPEGSAWRGSCIGWSHDEGFIADYETRYGAQLQLYRFFSKNPITKEMRLFVKAGGVLWYNIAIDDWRGAVAGNEDKYIDYHAQRVQSFAPANVIVCLSHEPDHDVRPGHTAKDFRDMWSYVQGRFQSAGTTNVAWAIDYSTGLQRAVTDPKTGHTKQWENALELWPGSDKVDWLFFNHFERGMDPKIGNDFNGMFKTTYEMLEGARDCAVGPCNFQDVAWGVGAYGTSTLPAVPGAKPGRGRKGAVLQPDQTKWLQQARDAMPDHPRVKAYIYFDSKMSVIDDYLKPAYAHYLQSPTFTANDPQ
jgi:hypothetical protein